MKKAIAVFNFKRLLPLSSFSLHPSSFFKVVSVAHQIQSIDP